MVCVVHRYRSCHPRLMTVRVRGLDEFRRELRKVDKGFGKAFGKANKKLGGRIVGKAQPAVKRLPSPGGAVSVGGIRPSAKQRALVIRLNPRKALLANVLGTKSHMVFGRRISGSGPFQPWLGRNWTPEELYGIGPVLKDAVDGFVLDEYLGAVLDALTPAFPD